MVEGELINLESEELQQNIDSTMEDIQRGHLLFVSGFARLGYLLNEVRKKRYWEDWGFPSFGVYIKDIETKIQKKRSQIYNAISVADRLLPYANETQIQDMGITKATELAKIIKLTGKTPSSETLEHAVNKTIEVDEFKAELHEVYAVQNLDEKGKFYDLHGFYCTDEERQEIEYVFDLAAKLDPAIPQEYSEWQRRKEITMRLIRSVKIEWEHEVNAK